jgi:hypothetical protein
MFAGKKSWRKVNSYKYSMVVAHRSRSSDNVNPSGTTKDKDSMFSNLKHANPAAEHASVSFSQKLHFLRDADWDLDQYESRKVIVRMDLDGEPISHEDGTPFRLAPFFFIAWRGFDASASQEYAECTEFSPSPRDLLSTISGDTNHRKLVREKSVMIPAASLYFLNPEIAKKVGIEPHPRQDIFFPEKLQTYPAPILQPRCSKKRRRPTSVERIIIGSSRASTGRIPRKSLDKIPVLGNGIELRESRISGAGRGLYTTRDFKLNEIITFYVGHLFSEKERIHMQQAGLGTHCKPLQLKHTYLDGVKIAFKGMGAAQLVNHGSKTTVNCDWIYLDVHPGSGSKVIALRATRDVVQGEELYVNYGTKFWNEQQYHPFSPPAVVLPVTTEATRKSESIPGEKEDFSDDDDDDDDDDGDEDDALIQFCLVQAVNIQAKLEELLVRRERKKNRKRQR